MTREDNVVKLDPAVARRIIRDAQMQPLPDALPRIRAVLDDALHVLEVDRPQPVDVDFLRAQFERHAREDRRDRRLLAATFTLIAIAGVIVGAITTIILLPFFTTP